MKAKRLSLVLISLVIFLPLLFISASAHPGRTDSDGGHTDHSTGEYHYHHGYDAHEHYDINGDGVVDCPFDFIDRTGHDSKQSENTASPTDAPLPPLQEHKTTASDSNSSDSSSSGSTFPVGAIFIICYVIAAILFVLFAMLTDYLHATRRNDIASLIEGVPLVLWVISLPLSELLRRLVQSYFCKKRF